MKNILTKLLTRLRLVRRADYDALAQLHISAEGAAISLTTRIATLEDNLKAARASAEECRREWQKMTAVADAQAQTIRSLQLRLVSSPTVNPETARSTSPTTANPNAHLQPRPSKRRQHNPGRNA